jgi:hypothetical protein
VIPVDEETVGLNGHAEAEWDTIARLEQLRQFGTFSTYVLLVAPSVILEGDSECWAVNGHV